MDKKAVEKALKELKDSSKKRKFSQSVDLIINLKEIDLKKPEQQVDYYLALEHGGKKPSKVCALVGAELIDDAKKTCDLAIPQTDFEKYAKDKKAAKKLAIEYDFFIAQANIMPQVATTFGKVFGPKQKMPNPKAGCVVPPKANLKPLHEKLQRTVRLKAKETPIMQIRVGDEAMSDDELTNNIVTLYNNLLHHLPAEKNNIKNIFLKFTMSKPVKVE